MTFCNLMYKRDVVNRKPGLDQIGRITSVNIYLIYNNLITPENFCLRWSATHLMPYSPAAFGGVQLPLASERFLVEAGLPGRASLGLEFNLPPNQLLTLSEAFEADLPADFDRYRPIGLDAATAICLDSSDGWRLYAVDVDGVLPTRFVNSSVPQLAEFLLVFHEGAGLPVPTLATDKELEASAQALEREFRRIDPAAFEDEENWWPLIVTQRRDGLL